MGPLNVLFPLMFKSMKNSGRTNWNSYIPVLARNVIQPFRITIAHYFAFFNDYESLNKALLEN